MTYLEERVKYFDDAYRSGNALISDAKFDKLENNLLRVDPSCNYFNEKNKLVLPSLEKGQYKEWLETLLENTRLNIQPKLDGCAIGLQYIDGKLVKAISRKGGDVTDKLIKVPDVPTNIKIKGLFQVRGELYAPAEYDRPSYSQRQAGAFLRARDSKSDHLSFCAFQIINGKLNEYESLKQLSKAGFTTPENYFTNFTNEIELYRKKWLDKKLFNNYPTDGIVLKVNSRKAQLIRESNNFKYQTWQYAIKY